MRRCTSRRRLTTASTADDVASCTFVFIQTVIILEFYLLVSQIILIRKARGVVMGMTGVSFSSVASKGRVTIPKEIRDALGIGAGDKVVFLMDGDSAVIRKVQDEKLSDILGRQKPWSESSVEFQRRLRAEWRP